MQGKSGECFNHCVKVYSVIVIINTYLCTLVCRKNYKYLGSKLKSKNKMNLMHFSRRQICSIVAYCITRNIRGAFNSDGCEIWEKKFPSFFLSHSFTRYHSQQFLLFQFVITRFRRDTYVGKVRESFDVCVLKKSRDCAIF